MISVRLFKIKFGWAIVMFEIEGGRGTYPLLVVDDSARGPNPSATWYFRVTVQPCSSWYILILSPWHVIQYYAHNLQQPKTWRPETNIH